MNWFTKKIIVPESNATKEVDAIQLWEVRWVSLHTYIAEHTSERKELEAFPTEQEAQEFVTALRNAFALTRRTHKIKVEAVRAR